VDGSPEFGLRPLRGSGSPGKVEEAVASTLVGSSELGRRGIDGAAEVKNRRRSGSVGARSGAGEEEEKVR
jgi:hypothetical protein